VSLAVIALGALVRLSSRGARAEVQTRAAWRHCALWIVVGLYVSLAPNVFVFDRVFSPPRIVPSAVYDVLRASDRLGIATLMGTCVLAGVAFVELARRLPQRLARIGPVALVAAILGTMYVGYAQPVPLLGVTRLPLEPYPTNAVNPPSGEIGGALRASTGPLLELPIGPTALMSASAMLRSIYHRHPLLNGYSGYVPESYARRMELACHLPDRDALAQLVHTTGVALVLVHLMTLDASRRSGVGLLRCPPDPRRDGAVAGSEAREWLTVASDVARSDLHLVAKGGTDLLFRVDVGPEGGR
jgi:hypothetical protein